jgi:hypothetical protein
MRRKVTLVWETDREPGPRLQGVLRWVIAGLVVLGISATIVLRVLSGG